MDVLPWVRSKLMDTALPQQTRIQISVTSAAMESENRLSPVMTETDLMGEVALQIVSLSDQRFFVLEVPQLQLISALPNAAME